MPRTIPALLLLCFWLFCTSATSAPTVPADSSAGSCNDNLINQDETGIDCGGICQPCSQGTKYYISASTGNDEADGLSDATAWQTIAKVNSSDFEPGDSILFKRGDTWREQLVITWSGTPDTYIAVSAYGEGPKPRIVGSEPASNWTEVSGHPNIWQSGQQFSEPRIGHPGSLFFGEHDDRITWGKEPGYSSVPSCATDYSNLSAEYYWCYNDTNDRIYVNAPSDPDTRYSFVEVPQRRGSITMNSHNVQEYIVIDGIEMMFGTMYGYNDGWPMNYEKRGLIIRNCHIGYIGIRGGNSAMGLVIWHSDMQVSNNNIHDCGRRSISYNIYTDNNSQPNGLVFENVTFDGNTLHNGYHTTGFDISHGDTRNSILRNFTFRNNFIYDINSDDPLNDPDDYTSMGLYLWAGSAIFENFRVYNNVLKNVKQKLFAIGGGTHRNLEIFNNVLYGMNPNIDNYRAQATISGTHENLQYYNNIMFGTVDRSNYACQNLYYGGSQGGITRMDNNIYYQLDDRQYIVQTFSGSYHMDEWEQYQADSGLDGHSLPPENPLFVDPDRDEFFLRPESPAIDAGRVSGQPFGGFGLDIGVDTITIQ